MGRKGSLQTLHMGRVKNETETRTAVTSTVWELSIVDTAAAAVFFSAENSPGRAILALYDVGGRQSEDGGCESKEDGSSKLHFDGILNTIACNRGIRVGIKPFYQRGEPGGER